MDNIVDKVNLKDVGVIFVSPIIGMTEGLIRAFDPLTERGASIIGVDIYGDDYEKKTFLKVLKLTILPGANPRIIKFANEFPEHKVFDKIATAILKFIEMKKKIFIGGMSGGFIYAARIVQTPPDEEISTHNVLDFRKHVLGLFGISPLIFYPRQIHRPGVQLDCIPANIKTKLFFGDSDSIIPAGTIEYANKISQELEHIDTHNLRSEFFKYKPNSIRHQFFGGSDFIWPLKNPFWRPEAESHVIRILKSLFLNGNLNQE